MSLGIVLLCHEALGRTAQVAAHWAKNGCPVVIHVDLSVSNRLYQKLVEQVAEYDDIRFSRRLRCDWGTWSLVAASQSASAQLLAEFPRVRHVYLASGSCLPLRPVAELRQYLDRHHTTDFIESVTIEDVEWTKGGLGVERFSMHFPFSWKRHRKLFDWSVKAQRALGYRRELPVPLKPHMGSQWWCLTRQTLTAILDDPSRSIYDNYFKTVWIPDESYYQTLCRLYSTKIESRSLTLSKFDFQGKPHIFYDDHLQLLRRSDCFVARKIWPQANLLFQTFLHQDHEPQRRAEPNPNKIDRIFSKAVDRRTRGRPGLIMQSRFPNKNWENGITCSQYSVFAGFSDLFDDFVPWLQRVSSTRVHGHLFAADGAVFADKQTIYAGGLSANPKLRDYHPGAFLTNLIWNTRGERQCFMFSPRDSQQIAHFLARDSNAQVSVISGGWAIPLYRSNMNFSDIRKEAARLQKIEARFLQLLRAPQTKARVRIWNLADFVESPMEHLHVLTEEIGTRMPHRLSEAPKQVDLAGFDKFLQNLKNQGMQPHLVGDFVNPSEDGSPPSGRQKPYLVR